MITSAQLLRFVTFVAFCSFQVSASDFSFFTTMRAGFLGNGTWELGAGSTNSTTQSQVNYGWNPSSLIAHWTNNTPQPFQIGYNQSTNTGFVTVFTSSNTPVTASFTNPGTPLAANAIWNIPAASFFATASAFLLPSSITLETLSLSSGVQILSGALPSNIGASYSGSGPAVSSTLPAPLVFNPASSGGSWTISGTVRFSGLTGTSGGTAFGDQVQFGFGAFGTDSPVPETSSAFLIGAGLLVLGFVRKRRVKLAFPSRT